MLCIAERKVKKGALALKLDISKAYNRVEWTFLKGMIDKLGFPELWTDHIMVIFFHLGSSVKDTFYPFIYFYYVKRGSRLC